MRRILRKLMGKRGKDEHAEKGDSSAKTLTAVDDLSTHENDPVLGLQIFGTDNERRFPSTPWQSLRVGTDASAELRLVDPSVSRRHARLVREGSNVAVIDERSKNGTYAGRFEEDARIGVFVLRPGALVSFGHVLMVALSARTERLREKLQRFLGYHPRYAVDVDHALFAALRRRRHVTLIMPSVGTPTQSFLMGAPTLARILHKSAVGEDAPFFETTKRLTEPESLARIHEVRAGTLVVNGHHWPRNGAALRAAYAAPIPDSRLVLAVQRHQAPSALLGDDVKTIRVNVPTMEERGDETERAINATAVQYVGELGRTDTDPFTKREWAEFRRREWGSPENLEFHIRRLVRVVLVGIAEAAKLEGVSVQAMFQWAERNVDEQRRRP